MKLKRLGTVACVAALSLSAVTASAATIPFSGVWGEGVLSGTIDPGALPFTVNASGTDSWGVPGVSLGTRVWPDGDGFLDFHISFSLPQGVDIDATFGTNCGGGPSGGTVFCSTPFGTTGVWTPVLNGPDSISFFAPAGVSLDAGDQLFVNILFTGSAPQGEFTGSWTMDGGVPEPGTLALLGVALAGLGFAGRRRRR